MKTAMIIATFCVSLVVCGAVRAQTVYGPVVDENWASQTGSCVEEFGANCRHCAGELSAANPRTCNVGCVQVIQNCGRTIERAKAATGGGPTYAWVKRQINRALRGLISKEEFDRVIGELKDEIAAIKADLKKNWEDHGAIRAEIQTRAEAQAVVDGIQNKRLDDLERRADENDKRDDEQDKAIAKAYGKVRFEIGALGLLSSEIYGGTAFAGLDFAIVDAVRVIADIGLGFTDGKDALVVTKAGPMFMVGDEKNVGLAVNGLFLKEGFDDAGDAFLGVAPEFRIYFGEKKNGFFSLFGGVGTSSAMKEAPLPGDTDRQEREWNLGWTAGLGIAGSF